MRSYIMQIIKILNKTRVNFLIIQKTHCTLNHLFDVAYMEKHILHNKFCIAYSAYCCRRHRTGALTLD